MKAFIILFAAAMVLSIMGFYKYVYFISLGYGLAIAGQGVAFLFLLSENRTPAVIITSVILILYGLRLFGYLLIREIKSASYKSHMKTEIKSGDSMNFGIKILLWIFCALLYYLMITPAYFRFANGFTEITPAYIVGTAITILGIALESLSDISKSRQKKINPHRFCDKGLFAFVRCPNYLGELLIWTGILVIGIPALSGVLQWVAAITGYLGIVFVMFSGARRLEVRQNKNYGDDPEYQAYVKRVPIMIPFIPLYSVEKYKFLVL